MTSTLTVVLDTSVWISGVFFRSHCPCYRYRCRVCRDPGDDKFLDAALSGGATVIVSSDQDLQTLGEYQGIKVLSPREFAESTGFL